MFKKSLILVVVLLLVVATLAGCGQKPAQQGEEQQPSEQPSEGASQNVLRMAVMANPPKLDPVFSTDTSSSRIIYQIFEALVDYDKDGNVQPLLAESWDISDDKKTYTFHLRKGVHFHKTIEGKATANGGREATADDWVWTFNYILNPDTASPRAYFMDMIKGYQDYQEKKTDQIAGVSKVDDYTLKIEIEYPFAPFLSVLAYNTFNVLPKEDVEKYGKEQFNFHPVGTGPFKFEQWTQDDKVVLSKNEDYWAKDADGNQLPYLDGIEFRVITDLAMEWTEFGLGNVDQIEEVADPYYAEAKTKAGFQETAQPATYYYGFNIEKSPFDKKALRQAFNYAIDRKGLIDIVRNGRALPATGVLPPGIMGYDESIEPKYTFDMDKTKALLAEAGYPNGLKVELVYNTSDTHKSIAEALQAQFKNAGIDVSLKNIDWGALLDGTDKMEVPFFRMGWVADYPDPDNFLYVLLNSANRGARGNYSGFNNKEFDDLTNKARVETDQAKREELYKQAEAIAREEAPWLFIYHYTDHMLVQDYVKNAVKPFMGEFSMKYTQVKLEK